VGAVAENGERVHGKPDAVSMDAGRTSVLLLGEEDRSLDWRRTWFDLD